MCTRQPSYHTPKGKPSLDRESVEQGKSVDLGGGRIVKKKIKKDDRDRGFFYFDTRGLYETIVG